MKYYLDITLLPDAEANLGFLWQKVFQQVHIALVDNKVGDNESAVALSVVGYGDKAFPLGNKLRLLAASEDILQKLDMQRWLNRLSDYCHLSSIKPVPAEVKQYARFNRKNVKSIEKKAQRRAVHLAKSYNEVLAYLIEEGKSKECKLPFINVESQESKKQSGQGVSCQFLLFIEKTLFDEAVNGKFDCYGLSKTATVPWF
ncbi:type I-F CRISPR-associated endoribonuclease Cas6/Csy4 [Paraglaciecola sp. MB-3u-78]|jgi:CRISPR-associated endonuclease Csy4|uniref:type I-F CRISPR-associated endoribonuclease Cas6/Csy4 n=1 Tax=Paraglaciecola sp. MB-3u-78 TaxID=2058332 RepID=UPI000C342970|nr:type I-F CRISPR-associated endoribonuclease Cas6/Csy4 [Paraglaciecola sp. MB-3u-78]PKG99347.1 type I-F CRISPR-associated endoribonuclease Cas6/Csy4 [Paraglaciecola sp. MB-3u-78]